MLSTTRGLICCCATAALLIGLPAAAQIRPAAPAADDKASGAGETVVEDVIVTAQRRTERLHDVPLAITALGSAELARSRVAQIDDLSGLAPSLRVSANAGTAYVFLRGVGNSVVGIGSDSSVAVHQDGVYIASPRAQLGAYFDVERIEVVRGPQGDLYGRNATGGSINIITKTPTDDFEASGRLSVGNYRLINAEAAVSGPLAGEKLKARLAGFVYSRDGFGTNEFTNNDIDDRYSLGARLTLDFAPSDHLSIVVVGDIYDQDDHGGSYHYLDQGYPALYPQPRGTYAPYNGVRVIGDRNISVATDPINENRSESVSGTVTYEASDTLTLRSISGYRHWRSFLSGSIDPSNSARIMHRDSLEKGYQISQEAQALLSFRGVDLVLGGYYFHSDIEGYTNLDRTTVTRICGTPALPGCSRFGVASSSGDLRTDAYAAFANAKLSLTSSLRAILGLRYSYETRETTGYNQSTLPPGLATITGGKESFDAFTPKIGLQFDLTPDTMLYATASRGFKSGNFAVGFAQPASPATVPPSLVSLPALKPEYVWSYEVGAKARLAPGFDLNLAAFYYDYTDLVTQRVSSGYLITENAAAVTIKGAELELIARPMTGLRLSGSVSYLDASYDSYVTPNPAPYGLPPTGYPGAPPVGAPPAGFPAVLNLAGNRLPQAPEWSLRAGFEYVIPVSSGEFTLGGEVRYSSKVYLDQYQSVRNMQPEYATVDARIAYQSDGSWGVALWGKNLTDHRVVASAIVSGPDTYYARGGYLQDPLTVGADLTFKF